jgi:ribosomal protein S18 acetylase RimI-like enzyme
MTLTATYFKRYRMEADLRQCDCSETPAPARYRAVPWEPGLLETHAQTKYRSFSEEIDAQVFPCLGDPEGCLRLMREIAAKAGFLPEATWLAVYDDPENGQPDYCGTIQGLDTQSGYGSIQNLGVVPQHRGRGLGRCLLRRALHGFWQAGLVRVSLEVTADNYSAIRLYRQQGFTVVKTVFKSADAPCP